MKIMKALRITCALAIVVGFGAKGSEPFVKSSDDRARIEQALPPRAIVPPVKPRRLLIFTLNVGYGGHPSIAYANEAFTAMGRKTGAFETVVSSDPAAFERDSLKTFDAVFFNNTVGNCFTNADLRQNLLEFITGGGGLLGVHGTSVAFTRWPGAIEDWPEFGCLIGARGANHKDSNEDVWMKLDDPDHPINRVFGGRGFEYRDEFFRPQGTYSRLRDRVLLSIDTTRTDPNKGQPRGDCYRADNDYAVAWVRNYGRGRVFYCTIAHNPYVFYDPTMLQFYLAAIQFALGDLPCPTTPSARLTPAVRSQEELGWRLGLEPADVRNLTLFDSFEQAAQAGLVYVGGSSRQSVSKELAKRFGPELNDTELSQIRLKLDGVGLRLLTCEIGSLPEDELECRRLFHFARKMGIETFIVALNPDTLDLTERLSAEYDVNVAFHGELEPVLKAIRDRNPHLGACGDVKAWLEAGVDPIQAVRALKWRLLTLDLPEPSKPGNREQATASTERNERLLSEVRRLQWHPTMFGLSDSDDGRSSAGTLAAAREEFDRITLNLSKTEER